MLPVTFSQPDRRQTSARNSVIIQRPTSLAIRTFVTVIPFQFLTAQGQCSNSSLRSSAKTSDSSLRLIAQTLKLTAEEHGGFHRGPQRKSKLRHYRSFAPVDTAQPNRQ